MNGSFVPEFSNLPANEKQARVAESNLLNIIDQQEAEISH
jgi:hypothetical protein